MIDYLKRQTCETLLIVRKTKSPKKKKTEEYGRLYVRFTVCGEKKEFATIIKINLSKWDQRCKRLLGRSIEAEETNKKIVALEKRISNVLLELLESGDPITLENLLVYYTKKEGASANSILDLYDKLVEEKRKERELRKKDKEGKKGIAESTFKKYLFARNRMEYYLRHKRNLKESAPKEKFDISIKNVDHNFIDDFYFFLLSECSCEHNSAVKHLWYLKSIIENAWKNNLIKLNPFSNKRLNYNKVERCFLEEEELEKLITFTSKSKRLERVKDVFLFCCYTGLSYSDVSKLTNEHISTDSTGKRWIKLYRTKTNILSVIPLFDIPEMILKKYSNDALQECSFSKNERVEGALLPVCSNQKMNSTLKDIAALCDINENITTHSARHTFATYCLLIGITIESISKMLGHTKIKTTQIYARITRRKIDKEMVAKKQDLNKFSLLYSQNLKKVS